MTATLSRDRLDPATVRLAVILILGVAPASFDSTIVNVALHAIGQDLHASVSVSQWLITGYVLAMAAIMPVTGWATARFGTRRMWLFALAVFVVGSVLSGAAPSMGWLIALRALQGVGAGLMLPVMQTALVTAAGGRSVGQIMALTSIAAVTGPILGPVAGGLITGYGSWRWIFWINIPFGVVGFVLAWWVMKPGEPAPRQSLDLIGLALLPASLVAIIFGLSQLDGRRGSLRVAVLAPMLIGALLAVGFVVHALHARARALIDVRLFRVRSFAASAAMLFVYGMVLQGSLFLLPLYYQLERGYGVLATGLLLAPQGIGTLLVRGRTGVLSDRYGSRPVVLIGLVLAVAGTLPFTQAGPHTSTVLLALSLLVRGAGLGALNIPIMSGAYRDLRRDQIPHASSATRIAQQLGGAFGAATTAVLLQTLLADHAGAAGHRSFDSAFWLPLALTALIAIPAMTLRPLAERTGVDG